MTMSAALPAALSSLRTKVGPVLVLAAQPVDEAVDGGGVAAALAAHDMGRLAGEGGEDDVAAALLRDMAGERGLAGAGIAEEAEDLRLAGLQPGGDRGQRFVLLGRPLHRPRFSRRRPEHRQPPPSAPTMQSLSFPCTPFKEIPASRRAPRLAAANFGDSDARFQPAAIVPTAARANDVEKRGLRHRTTGHAILGSFCFGSRGNRHAGFD